MTEVPPPAGGTAEPAPPLSPIQTYMGWAAALFGEAAKFGALQDTYPELRMPARRFDAAIAALQFNTMTVMAFKAADGLPYSSVVWHLNHCYDMLKRPGDFDAMASYGLLVLVYEKPVEPRLRDKIVSLRRRSMFGGTQVQVAIVELDAKAVWTANLPRLVTPIFGPMHDALGRTGVPPAPPAPPRRYGQTARSTTPAYATFLVILACLVVHLGVDLSEGRASERMLEYRFGSLLGVSVEHGEWGRLLTAAFVHHHWDHIFGNVCGLAVYGMTVEMLFGPGWTLAIFTATALCGNVLCQWLLFPGTLARGASGGVMGLFGVLLAVYLFRRDRLSPRTIGFLIRGTGVYIAFMVLGEYLDPGSLKEHLLYNYAHFGGLVSGFLIGRFLPFSGEGSSARTGSLVGAGAVVLCVLAGIGTASHADWAPTDFAPAEHAPPHLAFKLPERWLEIEAPREDTVAFTDGRTGEIEVAWVPQPIWILLDWSMDAQREWLTAFYRRIFEGAQARGFYQRRVDFSELTVVKAVAGGGEALEVRGVLREVLTADWAGVFRQRQEERRTFEDLWLPCTLGFGLLQMKCAPEDEAYYRPIFTQIRNSLATTEPLARPAVAAAPVQ